MNLYTIIKENLNTFAAEFAQNSHEWYPAHVINNLEALTNFFASNFLEVATEQEKELFEVYKEKCKHEKEFYKNYREKFHGQQLLGSEVAERFKKMLWSITQYAKKLDCYSNEVIKEQTPVKSNQVNNSNLNLSEIRNKIAEIEKQLSELKKLIS